MPQNHTIIKHCNKEKKTVEVLRKRRNNKDVFLLLLNRDCVLDA
jgi:hypothetical protein